MESVTGTPKRSLARLRNASSPRFLCASFDALQTDDCGVHGKCQLSMNTNLSSSCVCDQSFTSPTCSNESSGRWMWEVGSILAAGGLFYFVCCILDRRSAAKGATATTSYTSLLNLLLCLSRISISMVLATIDLYRESESRVSEHLTLLLWIQVSAIGISLVVGALFTFQFFGSLIARCEDGGAAGSSRRASLLRWMRRNLMSLRAFKLVVVVKPSVLRVLQSRACLVDLLCMPISPSFPGWRWMWASDGLTTFIIDGSQVAIAIVRHRATHSSLSSIMVSRLSRGGA